MKIGESLVYSGLGIALFGSLFFIGSAITGLIILTIGAVLADKSK